jgi:hypothetical protein
MCVLLTRHRDLSFLLQRFLNCSLSRMISSLFNLSFAREAIRRDLFGTLGLPREGILNIDFVDVDVDRDVVIHLDFFLVALTRTSMPNGTFLPPHFHRCWRGSSVLYLSAWLRLRHTCSVTSFPSSKTSLSTRSKGSGLFFSLASLALVLLQHNDFDPA